LVRVPFSSRNFQGVICSLSETTDLPRVRDLAELLDPVPAVTPHQLRLARWIADYYAAPMSDVLAAMLPPGLGRKTVYALELGTEPNGTRREPRLSEHQRLVLERVRETGHIMLDDVQRDLSHVDVERAVQSLVRRKLLMRMAELAPPRVSSRFERVVTVTDLGIAAQKGGKRLGRAPRQRELLDHLLQRGPAPAHMLSRIFPGASAQIAALERKGFVQVKARQIPRSPIDPDQIEVTQPLNLSPAQRRAYESIARSIRTAQSKVFLLHGVTGSGKTEVYLQAVAETIAHGRAAIVMVPEISLTPQAVARFSGRFPRRVAVLHSKLSPRERVDEWQRIRHGEVDVVVGPRSALFAPFQHVGLIVVDEEHDPSYKQDASPRYNARDAAAVLSRLTGATVVFGSATPDVGTYHAALAGRIELLELPDRPIWDRTPEASDQPARRPGRSARPMPPVEVVDLRQELKSGNRGIFSNALVEAMNRTLAEGEQALLFLNRRGSATVVLCRDCGFVARCPHCDIPFTYHAAATRLICHRCDKRSVSPRLCPACRGPRIRYLGIGTQRVEEEVQRVFPHARVLRWDRDVTAGKDAHDRILQRFARLQADVLVGTQMIAKGLDFPRVTLVGVISADTGLHLPDFRAPERSFQLLTQVAGRAGRASLPSRVIVQTYTPEHYAIQAAKDHDYKRFYREEMSFRRAARYPPFARLIRFVYSAEQEVHCRQSAQNLRDILERAVKREGRADAEIIGPAPCFMARMRNRYYWQVIVRSEAAAGKSQDLHRLLDYVPPGWAIDVDPVDLL
jgi:primosomal protein N' (replication factor Y)